MNELNEHDTPAGGEQVSPSTWATTVDYFRHHPEYVIAIQDDVYEFVALRDNTGTIVAYLYAVDMAENFDLAVHRYHARRHSGAASDAQKIPADELDELSADSFANPRVSMDLSVRFAAAHAEEVVTRVREGVFVYFIDSERHRRVSMLPTAVINHMEDIEDDYLGRSSDEALAEHEASGRRTWTWDEVQRELDEEGSA